MRRYPTVGAAMGRQMLRLSPSSRLRQVLLRRLVYSSLDAVARGDIEQWTGHYTPDAVHEWSPGLRSLGFPARAVGREEMFRAMSEWDAAWESWTMPLRYLFDLGDRMIVLALISGRSAAAGVESEIEHCANVDISRGLASHEYDTNDWTEGLRAAGIDPAVIERLDELGPGKPLRVPVVSRS